MKAKHTICNYTRCYRREKKKEIYMYYIILTKTQVSPGTKSCIGSTVKACFFEKSSKINTVGIFLYFQHQIRKVSFHCC